MKKFTTIITLVLVVFSFNLNNAAALSKRARSMNILDLEPGEPGNKTLRKVVKNELYPVLKYQGVKIVRCFAITDAIKCRGKKGWRNRRCQAALAKSRCRAVGNVLKPFGIAVRMDEGGEERIKKSGSFRGVKLSWKNAFCTKEELKEAFEAYYKEKDSRKLDLKSEVSVVPETNLPKPAELIRLIFGYKRNSKKMASRNCLAIVRLKAAKTVVTPSSCPSCPTGHIRPAHKPGICPVCVKVKVDKKDKKKLEKPVSCSTCPKGQVRPHSNDSSICLDCVDVEQSKKPIKKGISLKSLAEKVKLGLAVGMSNHRICPTARRQVQLGFAVSLGLNNYLRVLFGAQTVQAILKSESEKLVEKRIPLGILGLEVSFSLKDLGTIGPLSSLRFGLTAKVLANSEVQLPAFGAFVRIPFKNGWYIQGGLERVSFKTISPLDRSSSSASSWNAGVSIGFRF